MMAYTVELLHATPPPEIDGYPATQPAVHPLPSGWDGTRAVTSPANPGVFTGSQVPADRRRIVPRDPAASRPGQLQAAALAAAAKVPPRAAHARCLWRAS